MSEYLQEVRIAKEPSDVVDAIGGLLFALYETSEDELPASAGQVVIDASAETGFNISYLVKLTTTSLQMDSPLFNIDTGGRISFTAEGLHHLENISDHNEHNLDYHYVLAKKLAKTGLAKFFGDF